VGGGKGNEAGAVRSARVMFRMMNAQGFEEHTVLSMNTDVVRAADDEQALRGIDALAEWLNGASG
jgi:hypothetical protein